MRDRRGKNGSPLHSLFEDIGADDVASVGGKNASLGEMVRNLGCYDIKVPTGFATTAEGYRHFLVANNLGPVIASSLAELKGGTASVAEASRDPKGRVPGGSRGSYLPSLPGSVAALGSG
jgi:pyruvate,water dikinase